MYDDEDDSACCQDGENEGLDDLDGCDARLDFGNQFLFGLWDIIILQSWERSHCS